MSRLLKRRQEVNRVDPAVLVLVCMLGCSHHELG